MREIQLNPQYLGVSPGVLQEAYSLCLKHLYPSVQAVSIPDPDTDTGIAPSNSGSDSSNSGKKRRIGIVSEHEANSSPGNVLTRLFELLGTEHSESFEFVFFIRKGSNTVFSYVTASMSSTVLVLDDSPGRLAETREMVAAQALDVLLYIALPTEKFTSFLSHSRLAPVQVGDL